MKKFLADKESGVTLVELLITSAVGGLILVGGMELYSASQNVKKFEQASGYEDDVRSFVSKALDCKTLISLNDSRCIDDKPVEANLWNANLYCTTPNKTPQKKISISSRYSIKATCKKDVNVYLFDFSYKDAGAAKSFIQSNTGWKSLADTPIVCSDGIDVEIPLWQINRVQKNYQNEKTSAQSIMTARVEFFLEDYLPVPKPQISAIKIYYKSGGNNGVNGILDDFYNLTPKNNNTWGSAFGSIFPTKYIGGREPVVWDISNIKSFPQSYEWHLPAGTPNGITTISAYPFFTFKDIKYRQNLLQMIADPTGKTKINLVNISDGWGDCRVKRDSTCIAEITNVKMKVFLGESLKAPCP